MNLRNFCLLLFTLVAPIGNVFSLSAPVANPSSQSSARGFSVTITSPDPGVIRYTTDGTEPDLNSEIINSGDSLDINRNLVLKTRVWDTVGNYSPITTEEYEVVGMVSAGAQAAYALKSAGGLISWGYQNVGQLGNGQTAAISKTSPVQILKIGSTPFLNGKMIVGGDQHALVIDDLNQLWAFGINNYGQLGRNNALATDGAFAARVLKSTTPGDFLNNIKDADGGTAFSVALDLAGNVYSWGLQNDGRLGNGLTSGSQLIASPVTILGGGNSSLTSIAQVSTGSRFAVARSTDGQLWSWGYNSVGQLGDGTVVAKTRAVHVKMKDDAPLNDDPVSERLTDVVDVSAGSEHVVALRSNTTENGTVWCWGNQYAGRLGNALTAGAAVKFPVKVQKVGGGFLDNIVQVAAGSTHSLALDENGNVWSWGDNTYGQLGEGNTTARALAGRVKISPTQYLDRVVYIAAGGTHDFYGNAFSIALRQDGTVYTFGYNLQGQLGIGNASNSLYAVLNTISPFRVSNENPVVTVNVTPNNALGPVNVAIQAAASDASGVIERVDFYNGDTLLNSDTSSPYSFQWSNVSSGNYTVKAVAINGVGGSTTAQTSLIVLSPSLAVTALNSEISETSAVPGNFRISVQNGTLPAPISVSLVISGSAKNGEDYQLVSSNVVVPITGYVDVPILPLSDLIEENTENITITILPDSNFGVVAVNSATMALKNNDMVAMPEIFPVSGDSVREIAATVSCLTPNVSLHYTLNGQDPTTDDPIVQNNGTIVIGRSSTLKVRAWDSMGRPSSVAKRVFRVTGMIAGGAYTSLAVKSNGQCWGWGYQGVGQLGNGNSTATNIFTPQPIKIGATTAINNAAYIDGGVQFGLVVESSGLVRCFGRNTYGQLGNGATLDSTLGVRVLLAGGTNNLTDIVQAAAGNEFSLALDSFGKVWSWGMGYNMRLGNPAALSGANSKAIPVISSGTIQLTDVQQVDAGDQFGLALKSDGKIASWGYNAYGQLGIGNVVNQPTANNFVVRASASGGGLLTNVSSISAGAEHGLAIVDSPTESGRVWSWGLQSYGRLGNGQTSGVGISSAVPVLKTDGSPLNQIIQVAAGPTHSLALDKDGYVWAWGYNGVGQLGDGSITSRANPVKVRIGSVDLDRVVYIAAGGVGTNGFSFAIRDDGSLVAWGYNGNGMLGTGNTTSSNSAVVANLSSVTTSLINAQPTVSLSFNGSITAVPADVVFTATPNDPDGSVARVDFYYNSTYLGTANSSPWNYTWNDVPPGSYEISAIAYDNFGSSSVAKKRLVINLPEEDELTKRYSLGLGTNQNYRSYVIPLDFQEGKALDLLGNNESLYPESSPWFQQINLPTRRHVTVNGTVATYDLQFKNPIAAFGSEAKGTPMYVGRSYRFGVNAGSLFQYNLDLGGGFAGNYQIFIKSYRKSDLALVNQLIIALPRPNPQNAQEQTEWQNFVNAGYSLVANEPVSGLSTKVQRVDLTDAGFGLSHHGIILSHKASNPDYYFVVESIGLMQVGSTLYPIAKDDGQTGADRVTLYAMSFDDLPPWRANVLTRPQFFGEPMPSHYVGKSVPELLNKRTTAINATLGVPSGYLTLDTSEELRVHPKLDEVVTNLTGGLPVSQAALTIANFVANEIKLTDALGYPEAASPTTAPNMAEQAIFAPGMKRNAYSTYLEGQGSPWEQCALLVYMLRKSGTPAAYVIPERNAMKMLDVRLSTILGFQIRGAMNSSGVVQGTTTGNQPTLIPVNWPWVAAYVNNQWVHLFPWMKDVEIIEGYDPYEFMPAGFDSGPAWLRKFVMKDPAIFTQNRQSNDDTPRTLFVEHLKRQLQANQPDISFDDLGMQTRYRKINYARFDEMPTPFEISGTSSGVALLNSVTGLFDTLNVVVKSVQAPTKNITTSDIPLMDVLDRRLLVKFTRSTATDLNLNLVMEPFKPGVTGTGDFVSETFATMASKQIKTIPLAVASDLNFTTAITFKMHRRFWQAFNQYGGVSSGSRWNNYLGLSETESPKFESPLGQGDMGALVIDPGKVTARKIDNPFRELLAVQEAVRLNPASASSQDEDVYLGGVARMVGLNYFHRLSESREELARLHKAISTHWMGAGLGMLKAKRNPNGTLPNGPISLVQPYVDMPFQLLGFVGNGVARMDSGAPFEFLNENDFLVLAFAELSAQEHYSLNSFFGDSESISTIKLLHIAGASNVKEATVQNYTQFESLFTGANPSEADFWNTKIKPLFVTSNGTANPMAPWTKVYLTPGHITGANGDYKGVGALVYSPFSAAAYIGPNRSTSSNLILNGGAARAQYNYSKPIPSTPSFYSSFSAPSLPQFNVSLTSNNYVSFNLSGSVGSTYSYTPSTSSSFSNSGFGGFYNFATSSSYQVNSTQAWWSQKTSSNLNLGYNPTVWESGSYAQVYKNVLSKGSTGAASWASSAIHFIGDPVNVINGSFYIDHTDLELPGPISLQLRRNYDSQSTTLTSLGYGWKPSIVPYLVVTDDTAKIYAADEDGSVVAYKRVGTTDTWQPTVDVNPGLCNLRNGDQMGGSNNPFNARIERYVQSANVYFRLTTADGSVRTFRERSFPLTYPATGNGTATTIDRKRPYLETWKDNRGNSLTFSFGETSGTPEYGEMTRVVSSNGNFLGFVYDSFRHMVEAFTSDGRRVYYSYDDQGDLRKVILADGSTTSYDYKLVQSTEGNQTVWSSTHLIEKEIKPEGRILVNTYDALPNDRRIKEQQAVVGGNAVPVTNAKFTYFQTKNPDETYTGYTEVEDGLGNKMRYDYASSLITSIRDQLLKSVVREWYPDNENSPTGYKRSIKKITDKRGLVTEFQYDIRGNVTEKKVTGDLTGDSVSDTATTQILYNNRGLPTESVGPIEMGGAARKREFVYGDSAQPWLATQIREYAGTTLLSEIRNTYESVVSGNIGAYGLLKATRVAAGSPDEAVTQYTNNSQGFATTVKKLTGTGDPALVTNFEYNLRGELVKETDALGRSQSHAYDGLGNRIWTEISNESGNLLSWEYRYFNKNGEIEWVDGPRYYPEDYVLTKYDGGGRPMEKLVWRSQANVGGSGVTDFTGLDDLVATTKYKHDKYGNLLEVLDPRRNTTVMTYDAVGQMLSRTLRNGTISGPVVTSESWTYESGGSVATATNALGGLTSMLYTADGKLRRQQNPDGTVLQWEFDLLGRPVKETLPNGSYREISYNDSTRSVTNVLKNSSGSLLATESETRDRRGNVVSSTDAEGHTFFTTFDALNRVKGKYGPSAAGGSQYEEFYYDAAGAVTIARNALNESVVTTTDAEGRTVSIETKDQFGSLIRRTAFEYSADHHAVTKVEGASGSPYRTTTWTDIAGGDVAVLNPDGGVRVTLRDAVGNAIESKDEAGHSTKWEYDAANRLTKTTIPGGAQITLILDNAGNLLERQMPGNTKEVRTFDNASRLLTSKLNAGSDTRQETFAYFSGGPKIGQLQSVTDARGVVTSYDYDDFSRNVSVTTSGAQPEQMVSLQKTFDDRGLLTAIEKSYTGTSPFAPSVRVERDIDAYGDIEWERVKVNGSLVSEFHQLFDSKRNRTALNSQFTAQGDGAGRTRSFAYRADGLLVGTAVGNASYSFTYGNDGRFVSQTGGGLSLSIPTRDGNGRPTARVTSFAGNATYTESMSWQLDGKLATASKVQGAGLGVSSEYLYNGRGQMLNEWSAFSDSNTRNWTYGFDPDYGFGGTGLGVRIAAKRQVTMSGPGDWEEGSFYAFNTDAFWRGTAEGEVTPANNLNIWNSDYDGMGNQVHRGVMAPTYKDQTLTWDGLGRLVRVSQRDGGNSGFDFTSLYDGLGRRIRTTEQAVTAGNATGTPRVTESYFDPEVEFLEVGLSVDGQRIWKIYGGDFESGGYGVSQGTGGLLATVEETNSAVTPLIADHFGHVQGRVRGGVVQWNTIELNSYGQEATGTVPALTSASLLPETLTWRGQRADPTGLINLGMRPYDPESGRFMAADPLGHSGSLSLYDYADGDPINNIDPDGRVAKQAVNYVGNAMVKSAVSYENWYGTNGGYQNEYRKIQDNQAYSQWFRSLSTFEQVTRLSAGQVLPINNYIDSGKALYSGDIDAGSRSLFRAGMDTLFLAAVVKGGSSGQAAKTTPLYRAVGPAELADINATTALRNLGSAEGKYFTTSAEAASSYAKQAVKGFGDPPYTIIKTEVPNSIFDGLTPATVDSGIPAWVIPNNRLPGLAPQVLDTMPIPR